MAGIENSGIEIGYELLGEPGMPTAALTQSGRFAKDAATLPELTWRLVAGRRRVVQSGRSNCGASDSCFDSENEESTGR